MYLVPFHLFISDILQGLKQHLCAPTLVLLIAAERSPVVLVHGLEGGHAGRQCLGLALLGCILECSVTDFHPPNPLSLALFVRHPSCRLKHLHRHRQYPDRDTAFYLLNRTGVTDQAPGTSYGGMAS